MNLNGTLRKKSAGQGFIGFKILVRVKEDVQWQCLNKVRDQLEKEQKEIKNGREQNYVNQLVCH